MALSSATNLKSEWDHFFAIVNTDDDWIVPMLRALEGVSAEQAFWRPGDRVASIVDITLHATGWLEATLCELLRLPAPGNEDWPPAPSPSEDAWRAISQKMRDVIGELSRAMHGLKLEELLSSPGSDSSTRSTLLTNILVHNAYHAGQIVKLRQSFEAIAG